MDVADILSELDDHGFSDTSEARKVAMLNDTYFEVLMMEPWPFLEASQAVTTTGGQDTLNSAPADFGKALALYDEDNDLPMVPERLDTVVKNKTSSSDGDPLQYYFIGSTIHLYPVPTSTINMTLYYLKTPNTLAAATLEAAILLPARHHRVLSLGTLVKLYMMEDDPELAEFFELRFDRKLALMREDLWMRQYDRPDRIHFTDTDELFGL